MRMKKTPWWEIENPRVRHYEDQQHRDALWVVLTRLPSPHPALVAFDSNAPTLEIIALLDPSSNADVLAEIERLYLEWDHRMHETAVRMFPQPGSSAP